MEESHIKLIDEYELYIEDAWRNAVTVLLNDESNKPPYNPTFYKLLDKFHKEAERDSKISLQPFLSIFELSIQWLSSLHILLNEIKEVTPNEYIYSPWVLSGAACSQAVAIRELCICGLDCSAKMQLRSLIESTNSCLITLYDRSISKNFHEAQNNKMADEIWKKYFHGNKYWNMIGSIMGDAGVDEDSQTVLLNWIKEEKKLLNQTVHTSYLAAALSTSIISFEKGKYKKAIFGETTVFSIRTLSDAYKIIWLFSQISFYLLYKPINDQQPLIKTDTLNDWIKINIVSHYLLNQVVLKYWDIDEIANDYFVYQ
jgi:hypothetical protein